MYKTKVFAPHRLSTKMAVPTNMAQKMAALKRLAWPSTTRRFLVNVDPFVNLASLSSSDTSAIYNYFSSFGKLAEFVWAADINRSRRLPFGFLSYKSAKSARKVSNLRNHTIPIPSLAALAKEGSSADSSPEVEAAVTNFSHVRRGKSQKWATQHRTTRVTDSINCTIQPTVEQQPATTEMDIRAKLQFTKFPKSDAALAEDNRKILQGLSQPGDNLDRFWVSEEKAKRSWIRDVGRNQQHTPVGRTKSESSKSDEQFDQPTEALQKILQQALRKTQEDAI